MKVLIITGNLAYPGVKDAVKNSKENVLVHLADTQIAAFLTPSKIIKEIKNNFKDELDELDIILVPGLIRKSANEITKELKIPTFKGPTDFADLGMVLDLIEKIELSESKPADKLIEEEKRKQALKFIEDFDNDKKIREELLKKPNNILVKNLPVGEDFPMRVLAEIANAPSLSNEELIKKCEYFISSGADMIDIGMAAGEDYSDKIPDLINTLRPIIGDRPLSIDTLNPKEIITAVECGIDLVLSLDLGNYHEVLPYLKKHNVPAVLLPTNFSKGKSPHAPHERVEAMEELIKKCEGIEFIADLILDPVNSSSIVDSISACNEFHNKYPYPIFFGVGNVSELMDTDSTGVNMLLAGIGMELGTCILFTPEESGKTHRSVYELAIASKMMFLAKNRSSIPKDLGINLVMFKDKHKLSKYDELDENSKNVKLDNGEEFERFVLDPAGSFKIRVEHGTSLDESKIVATHFKKLKADISIEGRYSKEIYEKIIKLGLVSRLEHAAYLGSELQKAEIAMISGKNYVQDFELFNQLKL
ncbi:dihydropteroate synthase-like protein [Methanobrevibacter sp. OttesenSCG-928-K11]|nr:dihydropteroate synthase-like protein [Methanobrevibacter sp. OttesenSCG-928-K11]MDL2270898.1 dihydropteroate synthase-like protein [Methanobrevibacter sp. OttesenSCG-928-I08]